MDALIDAARSPDYPAEISLVLSNKPDAPGLMKAKKAGVAVAALDHKIYASREEFERAIQILLETYSIDLICLAGFMRLLTPWFINNWRHKLINIHPALLPAYRGLNTHERALADGVKIHGCTVHYVAPEMDEGPIIAQAAISVWDTDTPDTLGVRVLEQEHLLYPTVLKLVASDNLEIRGNRVLGFKEKNSSVLKVPNFL